MRTFLERQTQEADISSAFQEADISSVYKYENVCSLFVERLNLPMRSDLVVNNIRIRDNVGRQAYSYSH